MIYYLFLELISNFFLVSKRKVSKDIPSILSGLPQLSWGLNEKEVSEESYFCFLETDKNVLRSQPLWHLNGSVSTFLLVCLLFYKCLVNETPVLSAKLLALCCWTIGLQFSPIKFHTAKVSSYVLLTQQPTMTLCLVDSSVLVKVLLLL